jgi:hypothetical protein
MLFPEARRKINMKFKVGYIKPVHLAGKWMKRIAYTKSKWFRKAAGPTYADALAGKRRRVNGYLLMELLVAVTVAAILLPAFLTVAAQAFQHYHRLSAWESLALQGHSVDESLYVELRFAHDVVVMDGTVRFTSATGLAAGYTVQNGILYRILDDNTRQPLTGNSGWGRAQDIRVFPYGGKPYFSVADGLIRVNLLLQHMQSGRQWPCVITVAPLPQGWEERQ